ncbi:hypothetical protein ACFFJY_04015 [Fictibacillus aquaticus]|uniref:DUF4367 domain-containing protein n=1 Tax=Fictibacillus aquaticus TaxID=2021314 RepID=A0A235F4Z7_9BACL|nr:hypothetical protein [Fictibacillus aquaticus]OYD56331.1 hypothetical protein CGZ90_17975 [Fictibacillus aquaticus]
MKQLTDEQVEKNLRSLPVHSLTHEQKENIIFAIRQHSEKRKLRFKPAVSFLLLLLLFASIVSYAFQQYDGKPAEQAVSETVTISPAGDITIKNRGAFSKDFYNKEGKKTGGVQRMTEADMYESINQQNIHTNIDIQGYRYPGKMTVDHQKKMEYIQIIHYYFKSPYTNHYYHVYFYTPFFDEAQADAVARTFIINSQN